MRAGKYWPVRAGKYCRQNIFTWSIGVGTAKSLFTVENIKIITKKVKSIFLLILLNIKTNCVYCWNCVQKLFVSGFYCTVLFSVDCRFGRLVYTNLKIKSFFQRKNHLFSTKTRFYSTKKSLLFNINSTVLQSLPFSLPELPSLPCIFLPPISSYCASLPFSFKEKK